MRRMSYNCRDNTNYKIKSSELIIHLCVCVCTSWPFVELLARLIFMFLLSHTIYLPLDAWLIHFKSNITNSPFLASFFFLAFLRIACLSLHEMSCRTHERTTRSARINCSLNRCAQLFISFSSPGHNLHSNSSLLLLFVVTLYWRLSNALLLTHNSSLSCHKLFHSEWNN